MIDPAHRHVKYSVESLKEMAGSSISIEKLNGDDK